MPTPKIPFVEAQMLIRKPAATVFNAFVDPEITRHFWFTKGSGKLEMGKNVSWEWEMYGVSTNVTVRDLVVNEKITIEWGEPPTVVEFIFRQVSDKATYVVITNHGFHTAGDELIAEIRDNTGGFTTVLDGLKAYLEHGINLGLIADKFPKEITGQSVF